MKQLIFLMTIITCSLSCEQQNNLKMKEFKVLKSADVAVAPVPALSSGLVDGDNIYITGQLAYDPNVEGVIASADDVTGQTELIIKNIKSLLASEGATFADVVKTNIFYTNPSDLAKINAVYSREVSEPFPARNSIGVAFLALPNATVEIEVVAKKRN